MSERARCPADVKHKTFHATMKVLQTWLVDEDGEYIKTVEACADVLQNRPEQDTYVCATCGAEAVFDKIGPRPVAGYKYVVLLRGEGNPDFRQFAPVAPDEQCSVSSLREASTASRSYIEDNDLDSSNWPGKAGFVYDVKGNHVFSVSYSGRIWTVGADSVAVDLDVTEPEG